jgi:hypothetical protein
MRNHRGALLQQTRAEAQAHSFPSMRWNLSPAAQVIVKVYSQEGAAS